MTGDDDTQGDDDRNKRVHHTSRMWWNDQEERIREKKLVKCMNDLKTIHITLQQS